MDMQQLLNRVQAMPDCCVRPPAGIPILEPAQVLPEDVRRFYELCGGLTLFESEVYAVRIPGPDEFVPVDPVLLVGILDRLIATGEYNESTISRDWYITADLRNGDYVVIDCSANKNRLGRCYAAFWDMYISRSATPVVARSFSELLKRCINNGPERWYFMREDFEAYGDAFGSPD